MHYSLLQFQFLTNSCSFLNKYVCINTSVFNSKYLVTIPSEYQKNYHFSNSKPNVKNEHGFIVKKWVHHRKGSLPSKHNKVPIWKIKSRNPSFPAKASTYEPFTRNATILVEEESRDLQPFFFMAPIVMASLPNMTL